MSLLGVHPQIEVQIHVFVFFCWFFFFSSLVIRGEKDEQAVLCSKDKTYDVKIADTSNMLLFIPGCRTPEELNADQASCNIIHSQVCLSGFICLFALILESLILCNFLCFFPRCLRETLSGIQLPKHRLAVPF